MPDITPPSFAPGLRMLAAAPHRILFFAGAANVLLAMLWWTLWLIDTRWGLFHLPHPAVPAGWMHATIMQYQVLPPFMFGFLLTVFPRWTNLPSFTPRHYLPVGIGLLGGQLLTLIGVLGLPLLLHLGAVLTLVGWAIGFGLLCSVLWRENGRTWHAFSCATALGFGLIGLLAYAAYLHTGNARLIFVSIKFGSIGLLLPVFFTVCHRMIPFFAGSVIPGYRPVRPMAALAAFWVLALAHLALELDHEYAWLWIADLPMLALSAWLLWRWWPRDARMPPLLRVLFIGFAWLPLAFALYATQSLWYLATDVFVLGRAPAHALFIGYFGSLLVAMVTRVTQGHSGRPLVLGAVAGFAFVSVQLVAIVRVLAEVLPDSYAWFALASAGWVVAFLPWTARSAWIYLTPRRDGKPG